MCLVAYSSGVAETTENRDLQEEQSCLLTLLFPLPILKKLWPLPPFTHQGGCPQYGRPHHPMVYPMTALESETD